MIEGTVAGLAAGFVARRSLPLEETTSQQLRLEVLKNGEMIDLALIDVVVSIESFIASRAIWDMTRVREVVLTRASPSNIGLSSIGGGLYCREYNRQHGIYLCMNEGQGLVELTAPIAPGLVETMHISSFQLLNIYDEVTIQNIPSILALDGEREVTVRAGEQISVRLSDQGPRLIDLTRTMKHAAQAGLMLKTVGTPEVLPGSCLLRAVGLCTNPPEQCLEGPSDARSN
jgi:hypothetical protein